MFAKVILVVVAILFVAWLVGGLLKSRTRRR
jgi:hypothetical protein